MTEDCELKLMDSFMYDTRPAEGSQFIQYLQIGNLFSRKNTLGKFLGGDRIAIGGGLICFRI